MAEYINARLLNGCDEGSTARALLLLSELNGMSHAARECGLSVECMRRQLNGTRPLYLNTVLGVMRALGLGLRAEAR